MRNSIFMTALRSSFVVLGVAIVLGVLSSLNAQSQRISGFECGGIGADPACDGWVTNAGLPSIQFSLSIACPGMPSGGVRFCQLPSSGGVAFPAFAGVGSPSAYPYVSGVTQMTRPIVPQYSGLEIDYNWSAPASGSSWFEILLVDPATQTVLDVFAQGASGFTPMPAASCDASFGVPAPNSTGLITATASVPPAFIGQPVEVVVVAGENSAVLISPISFVNVDELRYAPLAQLYPGNGVDAAIEIATNGVVQDFFPNNGQHDLVAGDLFSLRLYSPTGSLDNQGLALVTSQFPSGSPPTPLPLLGSGPGDVWLDLSNVIVVLDSLGPPATIFVPQLFPGGYSLGPYLAPGGFNGNSVMVQMFVSAPGFNPVNLGATDAQELRFL